jgi:inosine-uridine nucleoside N-ribohydrolase
MNTIPTPLIIDTDPGCDDAVALLLLLNNPRFTVEAITTVAGNSKIEHVTRNAAFIRALVGAHDVPIVQGAAQPLGRTLVQAVVHGETGLAGVDTSSVTYEIDEDDATTKLQKVATSSEGKLEILALGPLTNIATVLQSDTGPEKKISQITIMGGAIAVPGNKSRVAEYNFYTDPEAADIVMRSSIPKVLVPLDLCNKAVLTKEEIGRLSQGKISKLVAQFLLPYAEKTAVSDGIDGAVLYDPLAAYYLIDPGAFTLSAEDIVVETKGAHTAGMTIVEGRSSVKKIPNIQIATEVDMQRFYTHLMNRLKYLDSLSI